MNPYTGHLIDVEKGQEMLRKMFGERVEKEQEMLREMFGERVEKGQEMLRKMFGEKEANLKLTDMGYEPVPLELERAANLKLAGKAEATVSLTSGGKLSMWAAKKRKEKMVKSSRKRNRGR